MPKPTVRRPRYSRLWIALLAFASGYLFANFNPFQWPLKTATEGRPLRGTRVRFDGKGHPQGPGGPELGCGYSRGVQGRDDLRSERAKRRRQRSGLTDRGASGILSRSPAVARADACARWMSHRIWVSQQESNPAGYRSSTGAGRPPRCAALRPRSSNRHSQRGRRPSCSN